MVEGRRFHHLARSDVVLVESGAERVVFQQLRKEVVPLALLGLVGDRAVQVVAGPNGKNILALLSWR